MINSRSRWSSLSNCICQVVARITGIVTRTDLISALAPQASIDNASFATARGQGVSGGTLAPISFF